MLSRPGSNRLCLFVCLASSALLDRMRVERGLEFCSLCPSWPALLCRLGVGEDLL